MERAKLKSIGLGKQLLLEMLCIEVDILIFLCIKKRGERGEDIYTYIELWVKFVSWESVLNQIETSTCCMIKYYPIQKVLYWWARKSHSKSKTLSKWKSNIFHLERQAPVSSLLLFYTFRFIYLLHYILFFLLLTWNEGYNVLIAHSFFYKAKDFWSFGFDALTFGLAQANFSFWI